MPAITCYGSVGEIGGNKILVEDDDDARLLFDFGTAFGRQQAFFNEFLRPRATRGLLDPLALDLIPPLQGLYRTDIELPGLWERFAGKPGYRDLRRGGDAPAVDAVLLSHAHLDHNGDLSYVDQRVPVHTTRVTAAIARAMQVTGQTSLEREMTYVSTRALNGEGDAQAGRKDSYVCRPHAFVDGPLSAAARAHWEESPAKTKKMQVQEFPGDPCNVRGMELFWAPVDHSLPGAAGFAIRTTAGWLAYSGDIRFHGAGGQHTRRFADALAALHPVALLCEGTHTAEHAQVTENDVKENALRLVQAEVGKLVVADFGPRNVERLLSFLQVAQESQRLLVVQPKDVYLLHCIALADPGAFADPSTLPGIMLYDDPKAKPNPWEQQMRAAWADKTVTARQVTARPGDYILCYSLYDLNDLLDIECEAGGIYLYSNSRAYDDEQKVDLERLRNWARHAGLRLAGDPDDPARVPLHASGHAAGPELVEFVQAVRPAMLVPIHTEEPGWWEPRLAGSGIRVCQPCYGQPMRF